MSATPVTETSLAVFLEQAAGIARSVSVSTLINESKLLLVRDDESFGAAGGFRAALKGAQKKAEDRFEEVKKPLREAKAAFDRMEHEVVDPIKGAVVDLDERTVSYRREQQRLADEKRRADEEAARKEEEARRLKEAEASVEAGMSQEEALAILEEPVAPVLAPKQATTPKFAGVSFRDNWSAEVTDLRALVAHAHAHPALIPSLLLPNMPDLNKMAKAQKSALAQSIPGVRANNKPIMAGGAR